MDWIEPLEADELHVWPTNRDAPFPCPVCADLVAWGTRHSCQPGWTMYVGDQPPPAWSSAHRGTATPTPAEDR